MYNPQEGQGETGDSRLTSVASLKKYVRPEASVFFSHVLVLIVPLRPSENPQTHADKRGGEVCSLTQQAALLAAGPPSPPRRPLWPHEVSL